MLLQKGDGLLLKHPAQKVVHVLKMVIEILPPDPAALCQIVNGDLVERALGHQLLERHRQRVLGLIRGGVLLSFHTIPPLPGQYTTGPSRFPVGQLRCLCHNCDTGGGVDLCLSAGKTLSWSLQSKGGL